MNLKRICAVTAGKYGFGGNAPDTDTTEEDAAYEQSVNEFFFGVRQDSNASIRINRNQHTIETSTVTGTHDVPGYDKSRTANIISNAVSNKTIDAEPAPKLEK